MNRTLVRALCTTTIMLGTILSNLSAHGETVTGGPVTVITHVDLLPDTSIPNGVETGTQLLEAYVNEARTGGALAAHVITWAPTNNHFQIVEIWSTLAAFEVHVQSSQTIAFRNSLQGLIGSPYEQRVYFPEGQTQPGSQGVPTVSPF